MEVRPQETDFDFLVRNIEAAGVTMPLAPHAQTKRLHHLARLGAIRAVPVRPQLLVVDEPGPGGGIVTPPHDSVTVTSEAAWDGIWSEARLMQEQGLLQNVAESLTSSSDITLRVHALIRAGRRLYSASTSSYLMDACARNKHAT